MRTPQEYEARQREFLARNSEAAGDQPTAPWRESRRTLEARINNGIWLGDCDCGSGVAVEPTWPRARCFACGAIYDVEIPPAPERAEIEHLLAFRPRRNQNWRRGERLLDLAVENASHGVKF